MRGFLVATVVRTALGGCASATGPVGYPAEWAPIKSVPTADGCPDLQGDYSDRSDATVPASAVTPRRLSEVFARLSRVLSTWPGLPDDPVSVTIAQTPESLRVTFADAAGSTAALDFRRYHFSWSDSGRLGDIFDCNLTAGEPRLFLAGLNQDANESSSPVHLGYRGTVFLLLKASDGSLVMQQRHDRVLIWAGLVGSSVKLDSTWYRFPLLPGTTSSTGR